MVEEQSREVVDIYKREMQQHLMQMQPMMAAYYPNNVTTDHIQQYLDENKSLILKIVESQNSGKLSECAENQAKLQRNLMYLAAIADSQPQPPTMHPQYSSTGMMQPGAHYMQQQAAQQMTPQSLMAARSSMMYSQQQFSALQQQAMHSQFAMSAGGSAGLHMLGNEGNNAGGSGQLGAGGFGDYGRSSPGEDMHRRMAGGSKQDMDGRGGSSGSHAGDGGETLYLKSTDDGN